MSFFYSLLAATAWKSFVVLGAVVVLAIVLRKSSAATRHMVWTAAFAGLLALPLLTIALPALAVPGEQVVFRTFSDALASPHINISEQRPSESAVTRAPASPTRTVNWRFTIALVWLCGTAVSLGQMAFAWLAMARLRRKARPLTDLDMDRVLVLETARGSMPIAFGLLRPAIFLPADAAEWPDHRRRVVLLHELAHVRRGDTATHLLARAALSLYWWNPLAWFAWRGFLRERERAADDLVLGAGARPSEYAGHLLEIARSVHSAPALGWAAVAMARRSQLEGRLLAILDSGVKRSAPRRAAAWVTAVAVIALIAPLAALRAQDSQTVPADVDATIRAAAAQKNHEMLDAAAKAAEVYRKYDLARQLLDSSLAIRGEAAGQQSVEYGLGLVKIGDLERDRNNIDDAKSFYTKAASVLGNRPEAAQVMFDLGLLNMSLKGRDLDQAFDYFQKAQAADPAHASKAVLLMAVVRDTQKDFAGADKLFQQAVVTAGTDSADAATAMEVYAAFLQRQGREEEGKPIAAQAAAIRNQLGRGSTQYRQMANVAPLRAGGGVLPPRLLFKIEPAYSEEARIARYQGTVVVAATIGTDGSAQNMQVVRGLGLGLDEKALQAISQWKFQPGTKDSQPVPVMATIEVNFRLL